MFRVLKLIFRTGLHTVVYTVCAFIILLYVAVRVNLTGSAIERLLTTEVSEYIKAPVSVGSVEINWLNQVVISDLKVDTILHVRRTMVGFDILPLLIDHKLKLTTAQMIDCDVNLSQDTAGVLNIQPIIDIIKGDGKNQDPFIRQFYLGVMHLRRADISLTRFSLDPQTQQLTSEIYGIQDLNCNINFKDSNIKVRQLKCLTSTPYCEVMVEGSLIDNNLRLGLNSQNINNQYINSASISLEVKDIMSAIDSLEVYADIQQLSGSIEPYGEIVLAGTIHGSMRDIALDLQADSDLGELSLSGTLTDTTRFIGTLSSPCIAYNKIQGAPQNDYITSLFNTTISLNLVKDYGGAVSCQFSLNDSLINTNVKLSTGIYGLKHFKAKNILDHLSDVNLDAKVNRLLLPDSHTLMGNVTAKVLPDSREGLIKLDDIAITALDSAHRDTLRLEPLVIEGTQYRGYVNGPFIKADYRRSPKDGTIALNGRIPTINHLLSYFELPVRMKGAVPFRITIDSTMYVANGHIDVPAFNIGNFNYDNPLSLDVEADIKNKVMTLTPNREIDLTSILGTINSKPAHVGGMARGPFSIADDMISADLYVRDFTYIDTLIGEANIALNYDIKNPNIGIDASILTRNNTISHIVGNVKLNPTILDLDFQTDSMPLGFINEWTGSILQEFTGTVTGHVALSGPTGDLILTGEPFVDGTFTHDIVGTRFHLQDSFVMDSTSMRFANAHVYDDNNHLLLLNALIKHDHLHDFVYDVNLLTHDGFRLFDYPTPLKNSRYWGQLYTNGTARIHNTNGPLNIELDMSTEQGSWLNISPYAARLDDKSSYPFLTYRDKTLQDSIDTLSDIDVPKTAASPMQAILRVSATDQCRISVKLDPLSMTDELQCRGSGNLVLQYDPRNDLTIGGIYNIHSGNYNLNMQGGLLNKVFRLMSGSTIRFSGEPGDADLAIDALYPIPSANLRDLDENIATLGSLGRTTVPVDCKMAVTGQLSQPKVDFDLALRNVNEEVQAYVHNIIGTPEMLSREVLYLLLFNRFYTPDYVQQSGRTNRGGGELASFASSSVTAGINQLLNKVSDHISIGSNVSSERGDFSDVEADVSLTTRFLDDRLVIGGNFGYRDPSTNVNATGSSKFIGDFDIEYLLNSKGNVRFKAYSHSSQRDYNINNSQTTQGVGIILRKDF